MAACVFEAIFNYTSTLRVILQEMAENIEVRNNIFVIHTRKTVCNNPWIKIDPVLWTTNWDPGGLGHAMKFDTFLENLQGFKCNLSNVINISCISDDNNKM